MKEIKMNYGITENFSIQLHNHLTVQLLDGKAVIWLRNAQGVAESISLQKNEMTFDRFLKNNANFYFQCDSDTCTILYELTF